MKHAIIATCQISKTKRIVKTYAKAETAEKNLRLMQLKGSWLAEVFSYEIV